MLYVARRWDLEKEKMTNKQIANKLRENGFMIRMHTNGISVSLCGKVSTVEVEAVLDYKVPKEIISERLNSVFIEVSK